MRIDKYSGVGDGFRGKLAAAVVAADLGKVFGVGIDANGNVARGAGVTGVIGVICPDSTFAAGDPIDVMKDGEIVEGAMTAGVLQYANNGNGTLQESATVPSNGTAIGFSVEATRLIVSVHRS
jgi:hypothetical protein